MTSGTAMRRIAAQQQVETGQHGPARSRARAGVVAAALLVVGALVTVGLLTSRPVESADRRTAPPFTLAASDGGTVSLAEHRGGPVVLYFNEGAGCDSCLTQMAEIEKHPGFAEAGITVLPIVMNTAEQINADRARLGVEAPFLLDDGTVSDAYGMLGTGMHAGLPGHGFVLVDADGTQRWSGSYPSMWLAPDELLQIVTRALAQG
ncbi:peroxiredoxin [Actinotalea sp. Marseille-Q4924]|uniref:peroxiredoxin family protein n=1 Tax=Actinotalea sp. Marseille-Q4924 TaxID=2866571 RepID=UPI001CE4A54F|nr:peroxiredoxin family protein [Actinotalea sp. Marseille-Q4924]